MYVCHEKVTPSWIVDDDDIYMPKLPTLARSCSASASVREWMMIITNFDFKI